MLKVEKLAKNYAGKTVVDQISFDVHEGEIFALLGKSGCGKTTTLKMINRLIEPSSGQVFIHGQNILQQPVHELRRKIGYVIQENGLFPHYTVAQNISIVPHLLKYPESQTQQLVEEMLDLLELPQTFINKYPNQLSGGQQQRVAIARALATKPPLLLMDEPFSALDPITREAIRKQFTQLSKQFNIAVVVVTHDLAEAIEIADKICLMNQGKIEQVGSAHELLFSPQTDFVESFFETNQFESTLKVLQIKQLLPKLKLQTEPTESFSVITLEDSLYTVFKKSNKQDYYQIQNTDSETIGFINTVQLFEAFHHYNYE